MDNRHATGPDGWSPVESLPHPRHARTHSKRRTQAMVWWSVRAVQSRNAWSVGSDVSVDCCPIRQWVALHLTLFDILYLLTTHIITACLLKWEFEGGWATAIGLIRDLTSDSVWVTFLDAVERCNPWFGWKYTNALTSCWLYCIILCCKESLYMFKQCTVFRDSLVLSTLKQAGTGGKTFKGCCRKQDTNPHWKA